MFMARKGIASNSTAPLSRKMGTNDTAYRLTKGYKYFLLSIIKTIGLMLPRNFVFPKSPGYDGNILNQPDNPLVVVAYLQGSGWKWLPEYKNRPHILAARLTDKDIRELHAFSGQAT